MFEYGEKLVQQVLKVLHTLIFLRTENSHKITENTKQ